jgi:hypothetical protein
VLPALRSPAAPVRLLPVEPPPAAALPLPVVPLVPAALPPPAAPVVDPVAFAEAIMVPVTWT